MQKTVPCPVRLRQKLRTLDPTLLQNLLQATVRDLKHEIAGLGEVVAYDVKHIYAWVKHNNPRIYVDGPSHKDIIATGDPDCKLGVKRGSNIEQADGSRTEHKEYLWGYGSGVAAATTPGYGDVVLAEYTQPFNEGNVTSFEPLYQRTVLSLEHFLTHITADAASDAWYVYQKSAVHGGIAAIPKNQHGYPIFPRDADGVPRCPKGLRMVASFHFQHTYGYRALRYGCPLLFPQPTGAPRDMLNFSKGEDV